MGKHYGAVVGAAERLSSGHRINRAADDSAGLSMVSKMGAKVRSQAQAQRNIQSGISLLQTADGGLAEIAHQLKRLSELVVQAGNETNGQNEIAAIQREIAALVEGIDGIANVTEYNGTSLLTAFGGAEFDAIIEGLKSSWMEKAEDLIQTHYGLTADGVDLEIEVRSIDGPSQVLAYVSGYPDPVTGKYSGQEMHIDLDDFTPGAMPNGGSGPMYNDRVVAHEMVHAVMGRTMNYASLSSWFKEGTAEFIHGADERLLGDINANGGGAAGIAAVVASIDSWSSTSLDYSSGYAAVKYMHQNATGGIAGVMNHLSTVGGSTLDDALNAVGLTDEATFIADFKVNGAAMISGLDLTNADTGSVGGSDEGGLTSLNAEDVVPDITNLTDDPTTGFAEIWPDGSGNLALQVGINNDGNSTFDLGAYLGDVRAESLGLDTLDVVSDVQGAFNKVESALSSLGIRRAAVGRALNTLGFASSNLDSDRINVSGSQSLIQDADVAAESARHARSQILVQAVSAMLTQANQNQRTLLRLIENAG